MKQTITRLFDSRAEAEAAVRELEAMGISHNDLSIVAPNDRPGEERSFGRDSDGDGTSDAAEGAGAGAGVGAVLGGGAGLLAGLGMLAIPGVGPALAAGWLTATLVGAAGGAVVGGATGGLIGSLTSAGHTEEDAHVYAEGVRRGGTLVSARVDSDDAGRVETAFDSLRGANASARRADYGKDGWTKFDENAGPYRPTMM
jgi:hypothetical protein